jgi:alpha-L-fucosidase 2
LRLFWSGRSKIATNNLFDAHPPFQIDGNFGGSADFVEMLLQSSLSQIQLLPALPDAWSEGATKGLRARGGFEVNMKWQNNQLLNATLYSATGGNTNVMYRNKSVSVKLKARKTKVLSF